MTKLASNEDKEEYLDEMKKLATPENQLIFEEYKEVVEEQTKINIIIENRKKPHLYA